MLLLSCAANYLKTFIKISGWEVLLFLKIDTFMAKSFTNRQIFLTVKFFKSWILVVVSDK